MAIEIAEKIEIIEGFKRIHVNQNNIKKNAKHGTREPVITVKVYADEDKVTPRRNVYGFDVSVKGITDFKYRPDDPLSCGAKLWAETWNTVVVYGH